ncbi:MAG TPA: class I SAM-dependent methyltransferase [Polyangiaceae bacterium]|nr:class I SAM-dependent methyltransferase [Polyangiaceae bacterium]
MAQSTSPSTAQTQRTTVDYETVKSRQQAMWASGDFGVVGATLQLVGETLCEALDLDAGTEVLDVACGNGNATLAAARRFCRVTGLDYVPSLLHQTADRARSEHLSVRLVEGDAERLPFAKSQFDAALSTFGVMFAPNQDQAASELVRVVRPGGRIGLANWTPEGFVGQLLRTVGKHVPPPPGVPSPAFWGVEARLRDLFPGVRSLRALRRDFLFRYESTDHFIDVFRRFYGPTYKAFRALDLDGQARLAADITELATKFNRKPSSFVVPGEYLEVIIER